MHWTEDIKFLAIVQPWTMELGCGEKELNQTSQSNAQFTNLFVNFIMNFWTWQRICEVRNEVRNIWVKSKLKSTVKPFINNMFNQFLNNRVSSIFNLNNLFYTVGNAHNSMDSNCLPIIWKSIWYRLLVNALNLLTPKLEIIKISIK
jgi:hypothetical protein